MSDNIKKSILCYLKNAIRILIYGPLAVLVIIAILVGTSFGSRISIMLANAFVPNLELTYASGSLNRNIKLSSAHWSMDGIQVELKDFTLGWQASCLLNKQLCVSQLIADKINIDIDTNLINNDPTAEPSAHGPDFTVKLPFDIAIKNADLNNIRVKVNGMHFNAQHIGTQVNWLENGINVAHIETQKLAVNIPLENANKQQVTQPQSPTSWPLASLPHVHNPVPVTVDQLSFSNSHLQIGDHINNFPSIKLSGSYINTLVSLNDFSFTHKTGNADIKGHISLTDHYPMSLKIKTHLNELPELLELKPQSINLHVFGDFSKLHITGKGEGDTQFQLDAQANLSSAKLPYRIKLSTNSLRWPLSKPQYIIKDLYLTSQGSLDEQQVTASARASTPFYPQVQLATSFVHQHSQLNIDYLSLVKTDTNALLKGKLNYHFNQSATTQKNVNKSQPEFKWQAQLTTHNFKLSDLTIPNTETLPNGLISTSFSSQGAWSPKNWHISVTNMQTHGQLKDLPLAISGDIKLNNKLHFSTKQLNANILGAHLKAVGDVNNTWNITSELSIPNISSLVADTRGEILAHINVTGEKDNPQLQLSSSIENIHYQGLAIKLAQLNANYQLKGKNKLDISLFNHGINYGQYELTNASLLAKGELAKQQITLSTEGDLQLHSQIINTFDSKLQQVTTKFTRLDIGSVLGHWALEKPLITDFNNKNKTGSISSFCLLNKQNKLCLQQSLNVNSVLKADPKLTPLKAHITFDGQPSEIVENFLPANVRWQGKASLDAIINWVYGKKPTAKLDLSMLPGSITISRHKQLPAVIAYQGAEIHGTLDNDQLKLSLIADAAKLAKMNADININIDQDKELSGTIDIDHIDVQGIKAFFPQISHLKGKVSSKLALSGTLNKPQLLGEVKLSNGQFAAASNPTLLDNINMTLTLMGDSADLLANWQMGQGHGTLNGLVSWKTGIPKGNIVVKGQNLAVIAPPLAILSVSPELNIQFSPQGAQIDGNITIPSGDIKIVQLAEGGVPVSDDVVYKDSISASMAKIKPYPITTNLNIQVANKVAIEGMGLKGHLAGTLTLQQQPNRPPMLFGEIRVLDGSYKFLGQRLTIATGELQFVGSTSQPNLNIEAVRVIKDEDVTAGIKISGTPRRPVVTLFSNPAKEQAEILSYIIKGSGFSNKDQNDSLILSAALSLSTQLGNGAIGNMGDTAANLVEKIGISNVQLDANDDGRVAISGYIGDRLMVKYGIGVFNPGYEITVRYYLLSKLYLETISGTIEQSLDIYYSFDL